MMSRSQPLLAVRGLSHDYSGVPALADISLEVEAGARIVVLGPSGCGKTSLLHILSGLMPASSGSVLMNGKTPEPGKDTALVFQTPRLLPWRRVAANIEVVLKPQPASQRDRHVAELLLQVGLQDHANRWPHELSGGMKQRLALARALAMNVPLLLLDEPFANLDPLAREEMQQVLLDLTTPTAGRSVTSILVTHSVEEALAIGDTILLMAGSPGRIVKTIRPQFGHQETDRRSHELFYSYLASISNDLRQLARKAT